MKQEASKKSKKLWLWLVIGIVALLAVVGVVLALVLGSGPKDEGPQGGRPELYWNVDKLTYTQNSETGLSTREPGEDGIYKVRFAINGELVEFAVADKQLINYIDTLDAMGLVLDADGVVVDVKDPKDIATEKTKNAYIKSADGTVINANTSIAMNGMTVSIKLEDGLTEIYDVTPEAEVPGQIIQVSDLAPMDTITVYANDLDQTTHVYVTAHSKQSKVYWRAEQQYDSKLKETSRVPDENGAYSIDFFCDGERVTLKTKDKAIATKVDSTSRWKCHFGFTFDEEGYIIEQFASALGIGGIMVADCWDIVEINGQDITVQRLTVNDGSMWSGTIPEDCIIYDASYAALSEKRQGKQVDSLQMGDRVTIWTDTTGTPVLVYVSNRLVDSPAYWVPTRKYDSTKKETTREIGPSGYYEVELVPEGGPKQTYYIKDKETVTYLDSITQKCVGIKADANRVVEYVYHFEALTGYTCATQGGCVTSVTGSVFSKITIGKPDTTANLVLAANARVYNVSQYGEMGAATTLQPGDHVYGYRQPTGEILVAFITRREIGGEHLYWRLKAEYDSKNKVTTREPDADGWYYIDFAYMGKQVTLKTRNKDIVTSIDKLSIGATALDVSGDVILKVYDATYAYSGQKVASGYRYRYITDEGKYHCVYNTDATKINEFKMADDCVIYNVSPVFEKFQGERIYSIPYNAMLTVFCDIYGEAKVVYVRQQDVDNMYWKTETLYDSAKKATKRTPDADGYYWYDLAVNGECKKFKTKDQSIANSMDSYAGAFGLNVKGDEILGFVSTSAVKNVRGNGVNGYCVTAINGRKITLTYNKPGSSFGKTETITLSSGAKIYDVTPSSATFGKAIELKVGDTVRTYLSRDDETHNYVYVMAHSTRKGGEVGYCEVCKKDVTWNPVMGSVAMTAADGHWYITQDMTQWVQYSLVSTSKDYTICLDLNGKTLTRSENGRNFRVAEGETLNIMDSVGGGKIVTGGGEGFGGGMILMSAGGTVNMYGGTLEFVQGEIKNGNGGMVSMSGKETVFNLYGGTVTGGHVIARNGKPAYGGNFYLSGGATLNMYGGEISNGRVYGMLYESVDNNGDPKFTAVAPYGGNIYMTESSVVNILGGVVKDGEAVREEFKYTVDGKEKSLFNMSYGGNIYKVNTQRYESWLLIENATVSGGKAHRGGNINAYASSGATLKLDDPDGNKGGFVVLNNATIIDGTASQFGGNIMSNCANWSIIDSKILNGVSKVSGGNIYSQGGIYAVQNTLISDGQAANGGNVNLYKNKFDENIFAVMDGTVIENGEATDFGGNIYVQSKNYVDVNGKAIEPKDDVDGVGIPMLPTLCILGGEIRNGQIRDAETPIGENIYCAGHMIVQGGLVTGGNISFAGANEAMLDISGGTVEDEFSVKGTLEFTVSGAPKIEKLSLDKKVKAIVGEMTGGASIKVATTGTHVFTESFDAAQEYAAAGYFAAYDAAQEITVTPNNELQIKGLDLNGVYEQAKAMEFPADGPVELECPICRKSVEWNPLPANTTGKSLSSVATGHYYLSSAIDYTKNNGLYNFVGKQICINLNGQNLTSTARAFYTEKAGSVLNLMGDGVVTGAAPGPDSKGSHRGVLDLTTDANICGGTYISTTEYPAIGNRKTSAGDATVSIYNGTEIINKNAGGLALYVRTYGSLEINGGTVTGRVLDSNSQGITVSGAPTVDYIDLTNGELLNIGLLETGAKITVEGDGVFTSPFNLAAEYLEAGYFQPKDFITVTGNNELSIAPVMEYCEHCDQIVKWTKWTNSHKDSSEHYYIPDGGVKLGAQYTIKETADTVIDLRGQTMTGLEDKRVFLVYGSLSIQDSVGGGKIESYALHNSTGYGGGGVFMVSKATAVLNLYGGTLTLAEGHNPATSGGILNLSVSATLNVYGGEITGGEAQNKGQNIYADNAAVNISGGVIDGGIYTSSTVSITLSGDAKIANTNDGLALQEGKLLTLGAMEDGAEIYVSGEEGAITEALTNAADYLDNIKPAQTGWTLENVDGVLTLVNGNIDPNEIYQLAGDMDFSNADADGKVTAQCPVCASNGDGADKEWYPLDPVTTETEGFKAGSTADNMRLPIDDKAHHHYYLSENIDYTQNIGHYLISGGTQVCLNLNNQTLESDYRTFYNETDGSVLNIMGVGIVKGTGTGAANRGMLDICRELNLYGGTYECTNATSPVIAVRGTSLLCELNVYEGVTITPTAGGPAVYLFNGSATKYGALNFYGGTVNGRVYVGNQIAPISVSGSPEISNLDLTGGYKVTVGELTTGADITVTAEGVFTEAMADADAAEAAKSFFKSADADKEVTVNGAALAISAISTEPEKSVYEQAKEMDFTGADADGKVTAKCPVCASNGDGADKEWYPLDAAVDEALTSKETNAATNKYIKVTDGEHHHYYLSENVDYTQNIGFYYYGGATKVCLNLNGQNLTAAYRAFFNETDGSVLNIMGNGTVSGNGNKGVRSGVLDMCRELNLYGGTYESTDANSPVIVMRGTSAQCVLNIYEGTTVNSTAGAAAIFLSSTSTTKYGTVNVYGGTVNGKVYTDHDKAAITVSGSPEISNLDLTGGYKVTVGELTTGADIKVVAADDVAFTNAIAANAETYAAYFSADGQHKGVVAKDNALMITSVCPHCGDALADISWTEVEHDGEKYTFPASGHYKLTGDVTSSSNSFTFNDATATTGLDVVLDTCGFDINSNMRAFRVAQHNKFTVFDSVGGSEATSTSTISELGGSGLVAYTGTEVNIHDLTITGAAGANGKGNVISVYNATAVVNIYSGNFIGTDNATDGTTGGTVYNHGTLNIYGGTFNGVQMTNGLGGCVYSDGTLNVADAALNGDVYIAAGSVELSGAAVISSLQLDAGMKITLGEMAEGADVTVIAADGVFAEGESASACYEAGYFKTIEGLQISLDGNTLVMGDAAPMSVWARIFNMLCTSIF